MTNLFIVDDHPYLINGIVAVFEKQDYKINVVGAATSGIDALEQLKTLVVDVVLLDIIMPEMDGIACCQQIKELYPEIKVIAFTGELNPKVLLDIWLQKVDGMLLKTCGIDELVSAIKSVMRGNKIIGENVPGFFEYCEPETESRPRLTKTEVEVLKLLGSGLTRQEAADKTNRSLYAIEFHCKNLFKKFNTNRIHEVIAEARIARIIQ